MTADTALARVATDTTGLAGEPVHVRGVAVGTVGTGSAVATDTALATDRPVTLATRDARSPCAGEQSTGPTRACLARSTTIAADTAVTAADRVNMTDSAVSTVRTVTTGTAGGTRTAGTALTALTEPVRAASTGTTIAACATVLTRATIGAGQHTSQPRRADRTVTTGTASPRGTEQSPQRSVATDTTGTTVATRGDRASTVTTITAVAQPREPAGGTTIATGTGVKPVAAVATVAAEQATLTARAAVVDAARPIGVPSRTAAAVDPAAGAAVGVGRSAIRAVTERHQPVDLAEVEGRVRRTGPAEVSRPDTAEVQISQHRIPGGLAAEALEKRRPALRIQHHRPGGLVAPVGAQVGNGVAQVGTQQVDPQVL